MIHISRSVKENARKIAIVREKLKKTENKDPTLEELRKLTGLEYEEIVTAMEATSEVDSIYRPLAGEDGDSLTLAETARILGTNQVAVSRMERKILTKLRQRLYAEG